MISAELVAKRRIEVRERPMPADPASGEVLVQLRAVGICGSDLHWFQDGGVGHVTAVYPMVLGHEPVGDIVAVGPDVTSHRIGDRVAIEPSITCGRCEYCRSGFPNNCTNCVFMGGPHSPGFYRQFATVRESNADLVPREIDCLTATLIEPTAVIVHVLELTRIRLGDTVLVLGAGPIGLLTAHMARLAGATRILLADRVPHRLELGRSIQCADCYIDTRREKVIDAVMDLTQSRGADIVFDAAAHPDTMHAAIHAARPGGQFVLIGIPAEKSPPLDIHAAMFRELRIQTIKRSNHKGHEAIELIRAGKIPTRLITHRMGLDQTHEAFELVSDYRDGVGKLVIEMP